MSKAEHTLPQAMVDCAFCGMPYDAHTRLPREPDANGNYVPSRYCSPECEFDGFMSYELLSECR